VSYRAGQLDVTHAIAADAGQSHFHATLFANNTAVLQALVLSAQALVVFDRAKNLGTEQTVTLWLERAVVDRFRLFHFTEGPGTDHVR